MLNTAEILTSHIGNEILSLDETNFSPYITQLQEERSDLDGPNLGDFVQVEGSLERICVMHRGSNHIQTTALDLGSFYLGPQGSTSFSGSCINYKRSRQFDRIDKTTLHEVGSLVGTFWTFKDGEVGVGRGISITAPCRIFVIRPLNDNSLTN